MKSTTPAYNRTAEPTAEVDRLFMPVAVSVIGHFLLLGLLIATPKFPVSRDLPAGAISVNLVAVPSYTSAAPPGKKIPGKPAKKISAPKPKETPPSVKKPPKVKAEVAVKPPLKKPVVVEPPPNAPVKEAISLAPKAVTPKVSLKKKTYQAEKVVESAIKRIEQKTGESSSPAAPAETTERNPIQEALDRMAAAVEEKEAAGGGGGTTEGAIGEDATGVGGGLGGTGKPRQMDLFDIYRVEIARYIQKNWAYSDQLSGGQSNMAAWVIIEVTRQGEITNFWFEKRSGNTYLDESAARAIQKSNPLPPFPPGVTESMLQQGLRFTPTGIK
ncbi:MAG: TonB family protein [Desulfobacterales bacterium]|jgi:colicin import membrane protein|nr:TonB family protein [Desulfobacterales bacterium]